MRGVVLTGGPLDGERMGNVTSRFLEVPHPEPMESGFAYSLHLYERDSEFPWKYRYLGPAPIRML